MQFLSLACVLNRRASVENASKTVSPLNSGTWLPGSLANKLYVQFTAEITAILDSSRQILAMFESDNETEVATLRAAGESRARG